MDKIFHFPNNCRCVNEKRVAPSRIRPCGPFSRLVYALLDSSSRRGGAVSTFAAFPMQLWIICAPDRPSWHCTEPRRRLPRGTRSDGDVRCEFILRFSRLFPSATRLPVFFSANDHEHPIACVCPFSPTPSTPTPVSLDRPPVRRSCVIPQCLS